MVRLNIADKVVDGIIERHRRVRARLVEQYKATNPFRQEPIDETEMLYHYNQLTPEERNELINIHGIGAYQQMVNEMETLKQRRRR